MTFKMIGVLITLAATPAQAFVVGPLTVTSDLDGFPSVTDTLTLLDQAPYPVATGSMPSFYAAPIVDSQGTPYAGAYLSTGVGSVVITFPEPERAVEFLWGSIDKYNTVTVATVVGPVSFTGDLMASSDGYRGYGGSAYTFIQSSEPFTSLTLSSTDPSFEAATLSYTPGVRVAEPTGVLPFALGLLAMGGFAVTRRRKHPRSYNG